ncbi:hypothetical protein CYMTET_54023 [Cymbomonas tetramitiformis]|uniref:Uncharacterized protein n=1 Tax=Cymbomonas tetramitiformis TaxID=36881 RepID=A0AAE0BH05_9CHLO|nr:hypothetical protein CYMTET_54023 [Cymbomonas tetramitiformis]
MSEAPASQDDLAVDAVTSFESKSHIFTRYPVSLQTLSWTKAWDSKVYGVARNSWRHALFYHGLGGPAQGGVIPELPCFASPGLMAWYHTRCCWFPTLCAIISLHASIMLWICIWDNVTFTGLGPLWPEVAERTPEWYHAFYVDGARYTGYFARSNSSGLTGTPVPFEDDEDWSESKSRDWFLFCTGMSLLVLLDSLMSSFGAPGQVGGPAHPHGSLSLSCP